MRLPLAQFGQRPPGSFERKPEWLKVPLPTGPQYRDLKADLAKLNLATVCEEAQCPNLGECWSGGTATVMLMGEICTRGCRFCAVTTGKPPALDPDEPAHMAQAAEIWGLNYLVITSVNRDELPDGGASHFAKTVRLLKEKRAEMRVEVLTPDFQGDEAAIRALCDSRPDVFGHNVETVRRLTPRVRDPRATYDQSLRVLRTIKTINPKQLTKSSIMLGLGESEAEIVETMKDLRSVGCDILTLGQYLRPSPKHLAVERYVTPEEFVKLGAIGEGLGFLFVASGPLVRSSYKAGEFFIENYLNKQAAAQI
jgi:lipoic acid synthetase